MSVKKTSCRICKREYNRLDIHLQEKHNQELATYMREWYIVPTSQLHYVVKQPRQNVCLICGKPVIWLVDHLIDEHKTNLQDYITTFLVDYKEFLVDAQKKIHVHHKLKVWDCYRFYEARVIRMVNSLAYKKSLTDEVKEDLYGRALELFYRFHFEFDPDFVTQHPNFQRGKTDDYYEKYMFMKLRRQLWYSVQAHYININREFALGTTNELEFYVTYELDCSKIECEDLWKQIYDRLKPKQQRVLQLILQGMSQKEISLELKLTQSWVSSIKTTILQSIQEFMSENASFRLALQTYYQELFF